MIETIASATSSNPDQAMREYFGRHNNDNAVVIMRIPREKYATINDKGTLPEELFVAEHGTEHTSVVPPSWIVGYIKREGTDLVRSSHFGDTAYDERKPSVGSTVPMPEMTVRR